MRMLGTLASLLLLTGGLAGTAAAQTSSIGGRVTVGDSGQGIAGANVELRRTDGAQAGDPFTPGTTIQILSGNTLVGGVLRLQGSTPAVSPQSRVVQTGADGSFTIDNVAPGRYRLYATRANGYVPAEYGQRSPTGAGVPFTIAPGTDMTGLSLVMTPTATINGRVLDEGGEPSGYAHVQALRATYRNGQRTLTVAQLVQADERGVYRLFWLPPGEYYVAAKPLDLRRSSEMMHIPPPSRFGTYEQQMRPTVTAINMTRVFNNGEIAEAQYVPTYYPGTRDERRATPIAVAAGQNVQGLDIDVSGSLVQTRRLRGRVVHGLTGQPVPRGNLQIIPRDAPPILLIPGGTITNGTFDVGGALPGANYLVADGNGLSGLFAFDAGDSDLNDITVTLWPPVQISGQVRRSNATDSGDDPSIRGIAVTVRRSPAVNGLRDSTPAIRPIDLQVGDTIFTAGDLSNLTAPDGTFTLLGLGPGDYAVDLRLPPDAYVESMQLGSRDVLRNGLHLDGPPPQARLDIVIGTRGGTMTGAVLDSRGAPAPHATIVALPDARDRDDLFKTVTADESGRFEIRGLAPGDYEFLAFEQLEQGAWQSADEMREAEGRGRRVRITEGATIGGDLQLIPAAR